MSVLMSIYHASILGKVNELFVRAIVSRYINNEMKYDIPLNYVITLTLGMLLVVRATNILQKC